VGAAYFPGPSSDRGSVAPAKHLIGVHPVRPRYTRYRCARGQCLFHDSPLLGDAALLPSDCNAGFSVFGDNCGLLRSVHLRSKVDTYSKYPPREHGLPLMGMSRRSQPITTERLRGRRAIRRRKARSCDTLSNTALKLPSLTAIIRDYLVNFQREHEEEMMWFRNQGSFEDAMRLATQAQDGRGRRYSHQRRIKLQAITGASRALAEVYDDLRKCSSFHELWSLIGSSLESIKGVRELYVYDCASRLGAHLGLQPERVYLHAGTREGAKNLGLLTQRGVRTRWLEPRNLPLALRTLPPSDVENLLCIYKAELAQIK
jgi:hypothetical protein